MKGGYFRFLVQTRCFENPHLQCLAMVDMLQGSEERPITTLSDSMGLLYNFRSGTSKPHDFDIRENFSILPSLECEKGSQCSA